MTKPNIQQELRSSPVWEELQEWIREQGEGLVQRALEEEVTELLGRLKSERVGQGGGSYRTGMAGPGA